MFNKQFLKDTLSVLSSNALVLLSGIVSGLILPKLMGVNDYGYYKIFNLYIGYTALLHFGFVDGILLKHAGQEYSNLDTNLFRRNSQFFLVMQAVITAVIVAVSSVIFTGVYRFIFLLIGFDTFAVNVSAYYQYVSQSTLRFNELSTRKILQAVFRIIIIVLLYVLAKINIISRFDYRTFLVAWVIVDTILTIWYIWTYRDITFGPIESKRSKFSVSLSEYFRQGLILTVAYQVTNLILSLDRQFVSILYSTRRYAIYSFAYTLISLVTALVNAVSLVLFPSLRRNTIRNALKNYSNSISTMLLLVFFSIIVYFPLCIFIEWYLPNYSASLVYLRVLFPGLAINSCMNAIIFNYYKLLNANKRYFLTSVIILFIAILANFLAFKIFDSPLAISISSLLVLILWYILAEGYLVRKYHIKWLKNFAYILVVSLSFYIITEEPSYYLGFVIYAVVYLVITLLFYQDLLKTLKEKLVTMF